MARDATRWRPCATPHGHSLNGGIIPRLGRVRPSTAQPRSIRSLRARVKSEACGLRTGRKTRWFATSPGGGIRRAASRAEAGGIRDDDLLEADAIGLLSRTRYLKKGSGFLSKEVKRDDLFNRWGRLALEIKGFQAAAEADLVAALRDELWELVDLYQEAKQTAGQLDFSDLLFGARALLQNDDARRYFQDRFERIFVDEFQDTDPVQAEVMLLLAADDPAERDWRKAVPPPGKLFLVGDPETVHLSFPPRRCRPLSDVKSVLAAAGVKQEPLQSCRRSVQPILDFVNAAFEPLMGENYLPLMGGRPAIEGQPSVIALPMPAPYGRRNFSAKAIEKCAPDTVAGFVEWLIRQSEAAGWRVVDPETREPVKIAPEHICILFRNFTNFRKDATRDYVRALEARGIPHVLVGSKSFHGREEIVALRAALRAIEWPEDSLSVYAALRGPLFAISDERSSCSATRPKSLPHPLRKLPDDLDAAFEPIADGLKFLAALHRERNARPVAVTLDPTSGACARPCRLRSTQGRGARARECLSPYRPCAPFRGQRCHVLPGFCSVPGGRIRGRRNLGNAFDGAQKQRRDTDDGPQIEGPGISRGHSRRYELATDPCSTAATGM